MKLLGGLVLALAAHAASVDDSLATSAAGGRSAAGDESVVQTLAPPAVGAAGGASAAGDGSLEAARALQRASDWPAIVELLQQRGKRAELAPEERELYGLALEKLARPDEAAHQMDLAALAWERAGNSGAQKMALAAVRRLDPLSGRRDAYLRKLAAALLSAVEELLENGDGERALELAGRLPRVARGKDAERAAELLARARSAFEKVQLEQPDDEKTAEVDGELPLVELDTEHYELRAHLEPAIVERLGNLMDDLYGYYVRVYFDGDAKKARGAPATIRVFPSKARMLEDWGGTSAPDGWWSPGTNEVFCYDSRPTSDGSLDPMLETLFHEASHQFTTMLTGGGWVPSWFNEGTASFFEGAVAMADGRVLWPRAALSRLGVLRAQIAGSSAPRLADVIGYEGEGSYAAEYYSWGWGIVYFLLEYEHPATLEKPYRALYARYRTEAIQKGSGSRELFDQIFLGRGSPLGHETFGEIEALFHSWITGEVATLHGRDGKARELRLQRARSLLAMAEGADPKQRAQREQAAELLERALVHVEWVRTEIDKEKPDGELVLLQAELFERMGRNTSAAAMVELALSLSERGAFALTPERTAELEARLKRLDKKNAALRDARRKEAELSRTAAEILADYRATDFTLRAYTFASDLASVLGAPHDVAAKELRVAARERGLLSGTIRALAGTARAWEQVLAADPERFEPTPDGVAIECVRAAAFVDATIDVDGEYELRARFEPLAAREPGSGFGFVIAGAFESPIAIVGIDDRGHAGVWTVNAAAKGSGTLRKVRTLGLVPEVPSGAAVELTVRVRPDGTITVKAGDRMPLEAKLAKTPSGLRHPGLFAKNAQVLVREGLVEILP